MTYLLLALAWIVVGLVAARFVGINKQTKDEEE